MLHVDAKSRVLHATSMVVDPWLMPDLAHFACLMSSMVHVLCWILCDTAQPHAAFYIRSICTLHDTFCVL